MLLWHSHFVMFNWSLLERMTLILRRNIDYYRLVRNTPRDRERTVAACAFNLHTLVCIFKLIRCSTSNWCSSGDCHILRYAVFLYVLYVRALLPSTADPARDKRAVSNIGAASATTMTSLVYARVRQRNENHAPGWARVRWRHITKRRRQRRASRVAMPTNTEHVVVGCGSRSTDRLMTANWLHIVVYFARTVYSVDVARRRVSVSINRRRRSPPRDVLASGALASPLGWVSFLVSTFIYTPKFTYRLDCMRLTCNSH